MQTNLGLRKEQFIMKMINFLIKQLSNCSLRDDFRVTSHADICQLDRFSLEIDFKRTRSCNYGIPQTGFKLKKYNIEYK